MKKNIKLKPSKDRLTVPKVLNKIFPIECFYSNHGIIKTGEKDYSLCMVFKSFNSQSDVEKVEVFKRYMYLLDHTDVSIQFYFSNQNLERFNLYENINLHVDPIKERICYIILSTKAESVDEAANKLFFEAKKVNEVFKIKLLSIEEFINVIYHFYNPTGEIERGFFSKLLLEGVYINDIFASGDPEFERNYLKIGDTYIRYFYIRELPELIKMNYITELFKRDFEISVSMHIDLLDREKVNLILNEKFLKMKEELRDSEFVPFELARNEEEILNRQSINNSQKIFNVGIYFSTMAPSLDILEERSNIITWICKRYNANAEVLTYQTENALTSMMPIGNDKVNIKRILQMSDLVKLIYI